MDLEKIGEKLKNLRKQKGLTLEELSSISELSKGFLSQLERGQMSPSLDNFHYLLEALGTDLGEFFNQEEEQESDYLFSDSYLATSEDNGIETKWLIPNSQKYSMEPLEITISNDKEFLIEPFEGDVFGKIESGEGKLIMDNKPHKQSTINTFYLNGEKPIKIKADKKMKILIVKKDK